MRRKGSQVPSTLSNILKLRSMRSATTKAVHDDHDAKKCGGGAEWRPRPQAVKINEREGREDYRCSERMEDQSGLKCGHLHSHAHRRAAQDPAYEAVSNGNRYAFG